MYRYRRGMYGNPRHRHIGKGDHRGLVCDDSPCWLHRRIPHFYVHVKTHSLSSRLFLPHIFPFLCDVAVDDQRLECIC